MAGWASLRLVGLGWDRIRTARPAEFGSAGIDSARLRSAGSISTLLESGGLGPARLDPAGREWAGIELTAANSRLGLTWLGSETLLGRTGFGWDRLGSDGMDSARLSLGGLGSTVLGTVGLNLVRCC